LVGLARFIPEEDERPLPRGFLEAEKATRGAERRWKEPQSNISRQKPSWMVYQG
jgi:hypothetical protein